MFDGLVRRAPAMVAAYGGKYLVRGGAMEVVQGDWIPRRLVVIEFDSVARAMEWQNSSGYAEFREMLNRSSRTSIVLVEGV